MSLSGRPIDPEVLLSHAEFVRRMARALTRDPNDADDLVQDVWMAALSKGPTRPGPLRPWLAGVLRRRAADKRRRRWRRAQREFKGARPEALESASTLASRLELGRRVVAAVVSLREPCKTAVLLRHHDGLPPRRIAQITGVPVETVRTRIRRGLKEVRVRLERESRGNDRRPLGIALLALGQGPSASAVGIAIGVAVMKKTAFAALLLLGGLAVWQLVPAGPTASMPEQRDSTGAAPRLKGVARGETHRDPSPAAHARIEGTVIDGGKPASARVTLLPLAKSSGSRVGVEAWLYAGLVSSGDAVAQTRTDTRGTFHFADVPDGRYEIRATTSDGRLGTRTLSLPAGAVRVLTSIEVLGGPALLRGRARHADGRSFHGFIRVHHEVGLVRHRAVIRNGDDFGVGLFPTGEDGSFEIRGVARGRAVLAALVPGSVRYVSEPVDLPRDTPLDFVVDAHAQSIKGRVLQARDDAPIPGAEVSVSATVRGGHRSHVRVMTDGQGRFAARIAGFDIGVRVWAQGFGAAARGVVREEPVVLRFSGPSHVTSGIPKDFSMGAVGPNPVTIRLRQAGRLAGRVLSAEGPVQGVKIYAAAEDRRLRSGWEVATSDAGGAYRIDGLSAGDTLVFAAGGGWVSRDLEALRSSGSPHPFGVVIPSGKEATMDLPVRSAARLSGRVVDEDGRPLAGCPVHVQPLAGFPTVRLDPPHWLGTAATDGDGTFVFDTLLAGFSYEFFADPPTHPTVRSGPLYVGSETPEAIELRALSGQWIEVVVLDEETGAPIPHAALGVNGRATEFIVDRWQTDERGRAHVGPLPRSKWRLVIAFAPGYVTANPPRVTEVLERASGPPLAEVRLAPIGGGTVAGTVLVPDGIAASDVFVELLVKRPGRRRPRTERQIHANTDGTFRFMARDEAAYIVRATLDLDVHRMSAESPARAGDIVQLELAATDDHPAWSLRVLGADGQEVAAGEIELHVRSTSGRWTTKALELRHGRAAYRAESEVSEAWLSIYQVLDARGRSGASGAVMRRDLPREGGSLEVRLPHAASLRGQVTAEGEPLHGVVVTLEPEAGEDVESDAVHARARSNEQGAFALNGLGQGPYLLRVLAPLAYKTPDPLRVTLGQANVLIELDRGVGPTITVLSPEGRPAVGARVTLAAVGASISNPASGRRFDRLRGNDQRVGSDGSVYFRGLPEGKRFDLYVEPPSNQRGWGWAFLPRWLPEDLRLHLAPALEIRGRVIINEGQGSAQAKLWAKRDGRSWEPVRRDAKQAFVVTGLGKGERVKLVALGGGVPPANEAGAIEAVAGARDLEIRAGRNVTASICIMNFEAELRTMSALAVPRILQSWMAAGAIDDQGIVTFKWLTEGHRYGLMLGPTKDGRYGWLPDFGIGDKGLRVQMVRGETIEGHIDVPPGAEIRHVYASRDGFNVTAEIEGTTYRLNGLRPGEWTVHVTARVGKRYLGAQRDVATGSDGHITVHDK